MTMIAPETTPTLHDAADAIAGGNTDAARSAIYFAVRAALADDDPFGTRAVGESIVRLAVHLILQAMIAQRTRDLHP